MDPIYFWIIILLIILFVLDYVDKNYNSKKKVESFENHPRLNPTDPIDKIDYTDYIYPQENHTPYFEENKLVSFESPYTSSGLNFGSSKLYFQNFTTNGIAPPYVKCPACDLQYGCSNYPFIEENENKGVCTKCGEKICMDKNNMYVYARSVGRPRTCQKIKS
jgi:hypothetical protein